MNSPDYQSEIFETEAMRRELRISEMIRREKIYFFTKLAMSIVLIISFIFTVKFMSGGDLNRIMIANVGLVFGLAIGVLND